MEDLDLNMALDVLPMVFERCTFLEKIQGRLFFVKRNE